MSHELRTPLNSILGFAQLLQRKELPPDQVTAVEYILKGGRHLLNLINEVLEIARIESSPQSLSLEPVRVRTVVQESLMLVRPLMAESGIEVEDLTACDETYVRADRQRLTQVLLNLLSNAAKYNRRGGTVRIRCAPAPDDVERIRIAVDDTGPGIPPEKQERIFTPFERLGAETSGVEGTGLGLALSQQLTAAMDGRLGFETTLDVGSTFWAELRIAARPSARAEERVPDTAAAAPASAWSATILYIEDNLANLHLIESLIASRSGVVLMSALQGRMGIELARRHRPDVILLDLHLPDLRGDEVLRQLKSDPLTRDIPVIVITADAMHGTGEDMIAAGADAYLTKPLDLTAFMGTLDDTLARTETRP
jgi:CheY-like chemotaxis protein/anti-sigma regulatory factor (Ser/Thr protein kinase)